MSLNKYVFVSCMLLSAWSVNKQIGAVGKAAGGRGRRLFQNLPIRSAQEGVWKARFKQIVCKKWRRLNNLSKYMII